MGIQFRVTQYTSQVNVPRAAIVTIPIALIIIQAFSSVSDHVIVPVIRG